MREDVLVKEEEKGAEREAKVKETRNRSHLVRLGSGPSAEVKIRRGGRGSRGQA
jgi:hypothetical protein